jgi:hypothetical protein
MSKLNQNLLAKLSDNSSIEISTMPTSVSDLDAVTPVVKKKPKKKVKYAHVPFRWSTYKFLLNYPKKHWKLTIITNLLIVVTAVMGVYLPMLMGEMLDSTTKNNDAQRHQELSK